MALAETFPNPVAVELLDTARCHALSAQINDFENAVFGPDFYCDYETVRPWDESGSLFCAAVCGEAVAGRRKIFSVASVLITSRASRDSLLRGEIADYELAPWALTSRRSEPVLYFSSVISDNAEHLRAMYASLAADVERALIAQSLALESGFSIAAGLAGLRHMGRSGFTVVPGSKYLGKYEYMIIDRANAKTDFWQCMFQERGVTTAFKRQSEVPTTMVCATEVASEPRAGEAEELPSRLVTPISDLGRFVNPR